MGAKSQYLLLSGGACIRGNMAHLAMSKLNSAILTNTKLTFSLYCQITPLITNFSFYLYPHGTFWCSEKTNYIQSKYIFYIFIKQVYTFNHLSIFNPMRTRQIGQKEEWVTFWTNQQHSMNNCTWKQIQVKFCIKAVLIG